MKNKIIVPLNDGKSLVAELYNYDGEHPEICVFIEDNGAVSQDICIARPHENEKFVQDKNSIDVIVWADENNEDYTDRYQINIWEEENENV
jgi:hypothetical protein